MVLWLDILFLVLAFGRTAMRPYISGGSSCTSWIFFWFSPCFSVLPVVEKDGFWFKVSCSEFRARRAVPLQEIGIDPRSGRGRRLWFEEEEWIPVLKDKGVRSTHLQREQESSSEEM